MMTKLLHNLSNYCHGAMLSLLLTIVTGLVIYIVHCKHPPWAIPCHPLVLRWCGWRLAGRPWCRGPCCSAPGPPHPSCCSCPAPASAPAPAPAPACYHQRGENSCTGHFAAGVAGDHPGLITALTAGCLAGSLVTPPWRG